MTLDKKKLEAHFLKSFSELQTRSILESNHKLNFWVGSIRSGKTYASLVRFIIECTSSIKGQFCLITKTFDSFKRNILPLLDELIPATYSWSSGKRELYVFNRTVHVIGADDERAERKIRGSTLSGAYVDEISVIPESFYQMLLSRLSVPGSKLFATTNPDTPFHWLKAVLDAGRDSIVFEFRLDDNPNLSQETKDFYRNQYTGLWYKRFIEGLWVLAEGTVYQSFDEAKHVTRTYPLPMERVVGIDYGTVNPCVFLMVGFTTRTHPRLSVIKEYYWDSKKKQRQKTDVEYAEDLKRFCEGFNVKRIYIDPTATSFKAECRKQGIGGMIDAENDIENGIRHVASLLDTGALKVFEDCRNLIGEFGSYVWDTKAKERGVEKPVKAHDHALDALRYLCATGFPPSATAEAHERCEEAWAKISGKQSNLPPIFREDHFGL